MFGLFTGLISHAPTVFTSHLSSLVFFVGLSPDFFFARSNVNSSPPVMVWASWSDAPWFATSQERDKNWNKLGAANFWVFFWQKPIQSLPQKGETLQKSTVFKRCFHQRNAKFQMIKNVETWLELCKSPASILYGFLKPPFLGWWQPSDDELIPATGNDVHQVKKISFAIHWRWLLAGFGMLWMASNFHRSSFKMTGKWHELFTSRSFSNKTHLLRSWRKTAPTSGDHFYKNLTCVPGSKLLLLGMVIPPLK